MKGLDMAKPKKTPAKAKEFAFEKGDFVVYPTHGVGRVIDIEAKEIAGHKLDLFVISFEQERMMLRVPVAKAPSTVWGVWISVVHFSLPME